MNDQWEGVDSHWIVYFAVEDADATAKRAAAAGGRVCHGPFDTPKGRIAVIDDSHAAVFSIIQQAEVT